MEFNEVIKTKIKMKKLFEGTTVPTYGTAYSAGADLYAVLDAPVTIAPNKPKVIPTGVACEIPVGLVGVVCARSGLSCKQDLAPANKVGIIDADYYYSQNEGHIFIKLTNDSNEGKTLTVPTGQGFAQGIFLPFGITEDDEVTEIRNGGFGSTTK